MRIWLASYVITGTSLEIIIIHQGQGKTTFIKAFSSLKQYFLQSLEIFHMLQKL